LKGHLLHQSCFYLTRKLAHDHADALLHEAFTSAHDAAVRRLPQLNEVVATSRTCSGAETCDAARRPKRATRVATSFTHTRRRVRCMWMADGFACVATVRGALA